VVALVVDDLRLGSWFNGSHGVCLAWSEPNVGLSIAELLHHSRRDHRICGTIVAMDSRSRSKFRTLSGLFGQSSRLFCLAHCRRAQYGLRLAGLSLTRSNLARCLT
jgi:hypothetical protein